MQIKMKNFSTFSDFYHSLPRRHRRKVSNWVCELMMWSRSCFYYKMRGTVSKGEEIALATIIIRYEEEQKELREKLHHKALVRLA